MSASALIGQLKVLSTFDTSNFSKGVQNLRTQVTGAIKSIGGFGASLIGLNSIKAVGVATIAAGFRGLDALDKLSFDAAKIGATTQALAELQHAAGMADVETSVLQNGLQRLLRSFGDAQNGSTETASAFKSIGINLNDLKGADATTLFAEVADKLAGISDPALQASVGAKLLGKNFAEMKPLIDRGGDSIKAFAAEARAMGAVLSQDQTARANEANDAWDRFKAATDGATKQVAASLSPAFEGLFEIGIGLLTDVLKPLIPVLTGISYVVGFVAKVIATAISGIGMFVQATIALLLKVGGLFSSTLDGMSEEWMQMATDSARNIDKIWSSVDDGKSVIGETTVAVESLKSSLSGSWFSDFANDARKAATEVGGFLGKMLDAEGAFQKLKADFEKQIRQFDMSGREKQIDDVRQMGRLGGVGELQALDAQLTAKEKQKELNDELARQEEDRRKKEEQAEKDKQARIKQLLDDAKTDEEQMLERWEELVKLQSSGAITNAEWNKLSAKYFRDKTDMENKGKTNETADFQSYTAGAALLYGSQEARNALLRGAARGGAANNPMLAVLKNSEKIENKMEKHLAKIAKRKAVRVAV